MTANHHSQPATHAAQHATRNSQPTTHNPQPASHILMIRPVLFGYNEQTAASNAFQRHSTNREQVQDLAVKEFDNFVRILRENGVNVIVIEDTTSPHTPDSVFPNNWISTDSEGRVFLYPMEAENRRMERRPDIIEALRKEFIVSEVIDLSSFEKDGKYLEGTGSMVLDRENKIAYACLSSRTDLVVLNRFCTLSGYRAVTFHASDQNGKPIYHTNVMMCLGKRFAVICSEAIKAEEEKLRVLHELQSSSGKIVDISLSQMVSFAGNMLQVKGGNGEDLLILSSAAYNSLTGQQKDDLKTFCRLIEVPLDTIEKNGGGSARCMMAELYLPLQDSPEQAINPDI